MSSTISKCPECNSKNVRLVQSVPFLDIVTNTYLCEDCGVLITKNPAIQVVQEIKSTITGKRKIPGKPETYDPGDKDPVWI
ncbi:MAG: hypothetical protein ACFFEE_10005 [Candidatus Thorarchaeota archaeon]